MHQQLHNTYMPRKRNTRSRRRRRRKNMRRRRRRKRRRRRRRRRRKRRRKKKRGRRKRGREIAQGCSSRGGCISRGGGASQGGHLKGRQPSMNEHQQKTTRVASWLPRDAQIKGGEGPTSQRPCKTPILRPLPRGRALGIEAIMTDNGAEHRSFVGATPALPPLLLH